MTKVAESIRVSELILRTNPELAANNDTTRSVLMYYDAGYYVTFYEVWASAEHPLEYHANRLLARTPVYALDYLAADNSEYYQTINTERPWAQQTFWRNNFARWVESVPIPDPENPQLISYYASVKKRLAGVRTTIKPARYLKKFFGDVLSQTEIQDLGLLWETHYKLPELKFTQDANEIELVYLNGPSSCMAHEFYDAIHPSRVYAGPDLAVAYLGDIDDPSARCVVHPEKKVRSTVYGDYHRMNRALAALGYSDNTNLMKGARIQKIEHPPGGWVMPFIDDFSTVTEFADHFKLGYHMNLEGAIDTHDCQNTNGSTESRRSYCDDCEDNYHDDNLTYVANAERTVCEYCLVENYFYCHVMEDIYSNDDGVKTCDGSTVSEAGAEREYFFCNGAQVWYHNDDESIEIDGLTYSMDWLDDEGGGFKSDLTDKWYVGLSDRVILPDGHVYHEDEAEAESIKFAEWFGQQRLELEAA